MCLALTGCATFIPIDAPVVLNGEVKVSDCAGQLKRLGDAAGGDFLAAGTLEETDDSVERAIGDANCSGVYRELALGLPVRPGMVLHVATPSMGPGLGPPISAGDLGETASVKLEVGAHQPQLASRLRLPIRWIAPNGRLTPDEAFVLSTILSLHRVGNFGQPNASESELENVSARWRWILERRKAVLWNALIASLQVRRISESLTNPFIAGGSERAQVFTLALVVLPKEFCSAVAQHIPAQEFQFFRTGLFPTRCTGNALYPKAIEAFGLYTDTFRASGLSATVAKQDDGLAGQGYFLRQRKFNQATFVSAELNAVRLANTEGSEREWSLAEWEASGICLGPNRRARAIDRLKLRDNSTWFRILRPDDAEKATHRVKAVITQGIHARGIYAVAPDHITFAPSISSNDLVLLRSVDLDHVEWNGESSRKDLDPCSL